jgi:hypothetical protein
MISLIDCLGEFYNKKHVDYWERITNKSIDFNKLFNTYGIFRVDEMIDIINDVKHSKSGDIVSSIGDLKKELRKYLKKNFSRYENSTTTVADYLREILSKQDAWKDGNEFKKIAFLYKRHFNEYAMDAVQEVFSRFLSAHSDLNELEPNYFKSNKTIYSIKANQYSKLGKEAAKNARDLSEFKELMFKILNIEDIHKTDQIKDDILYVRELTNEIFKSEYELNIAEDDFEDKIIDWAEKVISELKLSGQLKQYFLLHVKHAPLVREMDFNEWKDMVSAAALKIGISSVYFRKLKSRLAERRNESNGNFGLSFVKVGFDQLFLRLLNRVDSSYKIKL